MCQLISECASGAISSTGSLQGPFESLHLVDKGVAMRRELLSAPLGAVRRAATRDIARILDVGWAARVEAERCLWIQDTMVKQLRNGLRWPE